MPLTDEERRFVERRGRFHRTWPWAAGATWAVLLLAWLALRARLPLLADPVAATDAMLDDRVPAGWRDAAVVMLPIFVSLSLAVVAVVTGLGFGVVRTERRWRAIVERLVREQGPRSGTRPPPGAR